MRPIDLFWITYGTYEDLKKKTTIARSVSQQIYSFPILLSKTSLVLLIFSCSYKRWMCLHQISLLSFELLITERDLTWFKCLSIETTFCLRLKYIRSYTLFWTVQNCPPPPPPPPPPPVNYFRKKLHVRCLTGFWMLLYIHSIFLCAISHSSLVQYL